MNVRDDVRIRNWLDDLERRLRDLPASARRDIVDDLRAHLEEVLGGSGDPTDTDPVGSALRRLGDPQTIAEQAYEETGLARPATSRRLGVVEILALILLPIGSLVVPVVGWFVGVILLWISDAWTRRQKLVGTLLPPLGLAFPLVVGIVLLRLMFGVSSTCTGFASSDGTSGVTCTDGGWQPIAVLAAVAALAVVALLAALVVPIRLGQKARRLP